MDKVRFSCPRCRTVMQTGAEKVGYEVACPHCAHRFRLVEPENSSAKERSGAPADRDAATLPPVQSPAAARTMPVKQLPTGQNYNASMIPQAATHQGNYACPYCGTTSPPIWKSEVSTVGWIVFAILLVTTCVFCFVGLFIRDRYRVCSRCKVRLG